MENLLVSTSTARAALGIGKTKLFDLLAKNRLERIRIGRKTLVTIASIKALAERGAA